MPVKADTNWSIDLSLYIVCAISGIVFALANGPGEKGSLLNSLTLLLLLFVSVYIIVRLGARFASSNRRLLTSAVISLLIVVPVIIDASYFGFFRTHIDRNGIGAILAAFDGGEVLVNTWGGMWFLILVLGWIITCWLAGQFLGLGKTMSSVWRGPKSWILRSFFVCCSLFSLSQLPYEATALFSNNLNLPSNSTSSDADTRFDVMTERHEFRELRSRILQLKPEDFEKKITPNILLIHVESLRWDMLTPELMPRIFTWLEKRRQQHGCILPQYHYSTGNSSGIGTFGILSGLPGYYYHIFRREHQPPLGLYLLTKIGYQFHFFAAMDWHFDDIFQNMIAPFDKHSVRLNVPKSVNLWRADQELMQRYKQTVATADKAIPRFDYLAWNSTHYNYYYPTEFEKFTPVMDGAEEISPLRFAQIRRRPEQAKNRFMNSVLFADSEIGKLLESLENEGSLSNSIVIVVGDHGEEFFEHGRFAHTFGFSNEQTRVVGAICFPSQVKSDYRFASHHDLVPTVLDYIGAQQSIISLLGGKSLLGEKVKPDFSLTSMSSPMTQISLEHMVIADSYKAHFINDGPMQPKAVYDLNDVQQNNFDTQTISRMLKLALQAKLLNGIVQKR